MPVITISVIDLIALTCTFKMVSSSQNSYQPRCKKIFRKSWWLPHSEERGGVFEGKIVVSS